MHSPGNFSHDIIGHDKGKWRDLVGLGCKGNREVCLAFNEGCVFMAHVPETGRITVGQRKDRPLITVAPFLDVKLHPGQHPVAHAVFPVAAGPVPDDQQDVPKGFFIPPGEALIMLAGDQEKLFFHPVLDHLAGKDQVLILGLIERIEVAEIGLLNLVVGEFREILYGVSSLKRLPRFPPLAGHPHGSNELERIL